MSKFTPKQQRFIAYYDGNASESARKAGYANPNMSGHRLMTNDDIANEIRTREEERKGSGIADREARQSFWTGVMQDSEEKMNERLKASELLGRSEADFTDKHKVDANVSCGVIEIPAEEDS